MGLSGDVRFAVDLSAALASTVMPAPWLEILHSGWPIFPLLAILSRWVSPYLDVTGAKFAGALGRAASHRALALSSACDREEFGNMQRARELLGLHWRNLDPTVQTHGLDQVEVSLGEDVSSRKLENANGTYQCYWTKYPNHTLGGASLGHMDEILALESACGESCGTQDWHLHMPSEPSESVSYVRWCTPHIEAAEGNTLLCPFARAVGLLGSAFRLLSNLAKLGT